MKRYTTIIVSIISILALLFVFFTSINRLVVSNAQIWRCDEEYSISEKYDCILVLGAGVKEDGTPSHMLEDRLRGAIELYNKGISDTIIVSGDCSGEHYDEVSVMEKYCLDSGVPQSAIIRDDTGFSTYESVYNTVKASGFKNIIIVTQEYHLYRAIYIAKRMGADADGFAADYRSYFLQIKRDVREYFARVKDFAKVNLNAYK